MDFNQFISSLIDEGRDIEDIAKEFAEALNAADAANKSKKDRDNYVLILRQSALSHLQQDDFTFEAAAAAATVAAARKFPSMDVEHLKGYQTATAKAMDATASFNNDMANGKDVFSSLLDYLSEKPVKTEKRAETDEEKISRFLRNLR